MCNCIQSVTLWYNNFKGCLEQLGFKLNRCDRCVENKVINGEKCTVCWYVDGTKISNTDSNVVDVVIKEIEEKFGKMVVNRGNKHNFLGMGIELRYDRIVKIFVKEYIRESILAFGETMERVASTPVKYNLFTVG